MIKMLFRAIFPYLIVRQYNKINYILKKNNFIKKLYFIHNGKKYVKTYAPP